MILRVRIIPNASRTEVVGKEQGVYKIRLAAPAIEGRGNRALITFLARHLHIAPSLITLRTGSNGKHKSLEIALASELVEEGLETLIKNPPHA